MKIKSLYFYLLLIVGMSLGLQGCLSDPENPNAQLEAEVKLIDDYLTASATQGVLYDNATGVRFIIHQYGEGPPPSSSQSIEGTYSGKLFNSSGVFPEFKSGEVDDNIDDITPAGLRYIYSILLEGSYATVFLPSKYGYGEAGTTGVPANQPLVYTVHLEKVVRSSVQQNQFEKDTADIHDYIDEASIANVTELPSGVSFTTEQVGSGDRPTPYSLATFNYKLRVLSPTTGPGQVIEQNTMTQKAIFGLINGLKIGMPKMMEGAKYTFYIPSYLGYGASHQGAIPANAILIFEIELTEVFN